MEVASSHLYEREITDLSAHICNLELNFRKTSSSNCWNSNNYPTIFCSNYWNLTSQTRNVYNSNRKQLSASKVKLSLP